MLMKSMQIAMWSYIQFKSWEIGFTLTPSMKRMIALPSFYDRSWSKTKVKTFPNKLGLLPDNQTSNSSLLQSLKRQ